MLRRFAILVCLACLAPPAAAAPSSCEGMIDVTRAWLDAHPKVSGTRHQTVDAQLAHQPTAASVARAKMDSRDHLVELLAEAQKRQRAGDMAGCEATLRDVMRMLRP